MEGLIALAVATILSPLLAYAATRLIERGRMQGAYMRLKRDPLYDPGSVFIRVMRGSTTLIGRCRVHSLQPGRIEVRGLAPGDRTDGTAMSWTVREFEALDPVVEVE